MRLPRLFVLFLMLWPFISSAHGYWLELEGTGKVNVPVAVRLYFGDYPAGERLSGKTLDKMRDITIQVVAPGGQKTPVDMKQLDGYFEGSFTPALEGTYIVTGLNDIRKVQDWSKHGLGTVRPIQYLQATYQAGKAATQQSSALFLDAVISKVKKKGYEINVAKNGQPYEVKNALIAAYGGKETVHDATADGKIYFTPEKSGLYIVSIEWTDKTPGEFKGKAYETVRHRLDVSLVH